MDVTAVIVELTGRVDGLAGLRAYSWPVSPISPPASYFGYPENLEFDATGGRGMDRLSLPLVVVAGRAEERTSRDKLAAWCTGSGPTSIKAAIEFGEPVAFDSVRVEGVEFEPVTISGVDYAGAIFTLDIAGQGAP